jgi:formate/nitrite transporter FocA (FNT family)
MSTRRVKYYKGLFLTAAIYDTVLGVIFTFFYRYPFRWLNIPLPSSGAYVTLIGAFLFVIGVGYVLVYRRDLKANFDLIVVGTLYKVAYSGVAFYQLAVGDIPHVLFALLFGVVDALFAVLFLECLWQLRRNRSV